MTTKDLPADVEPVKLTREEASAAWLKQFWAEKPCKNGHEPWRFVSTGKCIQCRRATVARFTEKNRESERLRLRVYKRTHREIIKAGAAKYREDHRNVLRKKNSDYEKANRAKVTARKKRRRQDDLVRVKARDAAYRKREAARYGAHWARWNAERKAGRALGELPESWDGEIYTDAKRFGLEVDHIIPLRPCRCCGRNGRHEPGNLQLLSASDNRSKGNRCQECWVR